MKRDSKLPSKEVEQLINQLTQDEDMRQDLWVAYLSGVPSCQLIQSLSQFQVNLRIESDKQALYEIIYHPIDESILTYMSPIERLIACLTALNCDLGIISTYTGIKKAHIRGILVALRSSKLPK